MPAASNAPLVRPRSPFSLHGASNVMLETVKRGEDDVHGNELAGKKGKGKTTVVLRLFEHMGGRGRAVLRV